MEQIRENRRFQRLGGFVLRSITTVHVNVGSRAVSTQALALLNVVPPLQGLRGRPRYRPSAVLGDRAYDAENRWHAATAFARPPCFSDRDQITENLFVCSCLLDTKDFEELPWQGITAILCLQPMRRRESGGIEWEEKAASNANLAFRNVLVRDFDAADLQRKRRQCVAVLDYMLKAGHTVYLNAPRIPNSNSDCVTA